MRAFPATIVSSLRLRRPGRRRPRRDRQVLRVAERAARGFSTVRRLSSARRRIDVPAGGIGVRNEAAPIGAVAGSLPAVEPDVDSGDVERADSGYTARFP